MLIGLPVESQHRAAHLDQLVRWRRTAKKDHRLLFKVRSQQRADKERAPPQQKPTDPSCPVLTLGCLFKYTWPALRSAMASSDDKEVITSPALSGETMAAVPRLRDRTSGSLVNYHLGSS